MAVTRDQVAQLYVATFNRAPLSDGLDYWTSSDFTIEQIATSFFDQPEAQAIYTDNGVAISSEAFVLRIFDNLFDRLPLAAGLEYWAGALDDGTVSQAEMILAAANGATDPDDVAILANKTEAGMYYADQGGTSTDYSLDNIDETAASLDAAKAAIDSALALVVEESFTAGNDDLVGGLGNDSFEAPIVQNSAAGGVSNSLSTADDLDGGAGSDSLYAELVPEFWGVTGNNTMDVQPEIHSVEDIDFEAMDVLNGSMPITVDAKKITDVDHIGSAYSDGDLIIENLTTLTSAGAIRNTDTITITMDHTDNFNSDGEASDLKVYFDEDYLVAGQSTAGASLLIRMLNAVNNVNNENPIEGTTALTFYVGTQLVTVDISSVAADATLDYTNAYDAVVDAINAQLDADGFSDVRAAKAPIEDAVFSIPVAGFSVAEDAGDYYPIVVTNSGAEELTQGQFTTSQLEYDTDQNNSMTSAEAATSNDPLAINVELEKVGRDGDGGNLIIGGKDQDDHGDTDVDQTDGIGVFNITVLGGEDKPSNLGTIASTNNFLATVNIDSAQPEANSEGVDTWADLTVRTQLGEGQELTLINATGFNGDFSLAESGDGQQALSSSFGGGDDTYNWRSAETDTNDDDGKDYSISMGGGDDTVTANLDGDSVDALGESFNLVTGAGDDTVIVDMTAGVSYATMTEISSNQETYLDINTGAGDDRVFLNDYGTFDIATGDGDDYIEIDANDSTDLSGAWTVFASTGADTFERVLYDAKLTVSFAGFETTIDINTTSADNYVATQALIASEIQRAIESDDTLNEFLTVNIAAGTNQVTITSDIDGENSLAIALFQPELLETGTPTADQTVIDSGDVSALRQGLLATETVAGLSATLEDAGEIATWTNADANIWEGQVNQTGVGDNTLDYSAAQLTNDTAEVAPDGGNDLLDEADFLAYSIGGSDEDTSGVNFSTINAGAGDDIIVLDSNEGSMNTIIVDGAFGYDRVVNFFDVATNAVDLAAEVGDHILDYSAYLTDTIDTSGAGNIAGVDPDSEILADTNVILATGERSFADAAVHGATVGTDIDANDVAVVRFDSSDADETAETFANLTGADLVNALNGDYNTTGDSAYANLAVGTLEAVAAANYTNATQNHIVMVENDLNEGEYKVFHVTSTIDTGTDTVTDGDFATATYLGTFDFGASVNLAISQEESVMLALQTAIDNAVAAAAPVTADLTTTASSTLTSINGAPDTFTLTDDTLGTTQVFTQTGTAGPSVSVGSGHVLTYDGATTSPLTATITLTDTTLTGLAASFSGDSVAVTGNVAVTGGVAATEYDLSGLVATGTETVATATGTEHATTDFGGADVNVAAGGAYTIAKSVLDTAGDVTQSVDEDVTITAATTADLTNDLAQVTVSGTGSVIVDFAAGESMTATAVTTAFGTIADTGVVATGTDTITISALVAATDATEALDTFTFLASDTGITITGFDVGVASDVLDVDALLDGISKVYEEVADDTADITTDANVIVALDEGNDDIDILAALVAADVTVTGTDGLLVIGDGSDVLIYHTDDLAGDGVETLIATLSGVTDASTLDTANFIFA